MSSWISTPSFTNGTEYARSLKFHDRAEAPAAVPHPAIWHGARLDDAIQPHLAGKRPESESHALAIGADVQPRENHDDDTDDEPCDQRAACREDALDGADVGLTRDASPRRAPVNRRQHDRGRRASSGRGHDFLVARSDCRAKPCSRAGITCWYPRQDSNLRHRLRRPVLYPLSYEGGLPGAVLNRRFAPVFDRDPPPYEGSGPRHAV